MSLSTISRHRAALQSFGRCALSHSACPATLLSRPRWTPLAKGPSMLRFESSAAAQARQPVAKYPELLNIYRAGSARTLSVGFTRVTSLVIFALGAFAYAPSFLFSPDHSILWAPAVAIAAAIPIIVITYAHGPVVHALRVRLPARARRSREELKSFANNVPLDTKIEVHCVRLWPWPRAKELVFGDLRRTKPSFKIGLSNLENVPEIAKVEEGTLWGWLVHRWLGRFYVERHQRNDKSAAPGLWDLMWEQIPMAGDQRGPVNRERKPVVMANRPIKRTERPTLKPPSRRTRDAQ